MNYRFLGRTGLRVSVVGMGTSPLRLVPEAKAIATLRAAFEAGINIVHAAPDYEGVEDLIARAIAESELRQPVHVCSQSWGDTTGFARVFDETLEKIGPRHLSLFGIAALYDREMLGENVWGKGGMVEFLLRKKEQGLIKGIFCTTHGPVHHTAEVLRRDVFDAIMLAWNPLGFHLLTYDPETLWGSAPAPPLKGKWEFEDLRRVQDELLPLIASRNVGLMVMKPLAGGLLCRSRALAPRVSLLNGHGDAGAGDWLRQILKHPAVSCVMPGMASPDEAAENSAAGSGDLAVSAGSETRVQAALAELKSAICSRCGRCEGTCSHGLPISWLFRSGYGNVFPSVTYETWDEVQYFRLHPHAESTCRKCENTTCSCPHGIPIREGLIAIHDAMMDLRKRGVFPAFAPRAPESTDGYAGPVLVRDVPARMAPGSTESVRLYVQNTGNRVWRSRSKPGQKATVLLVSLSGRTVQTVRLRQDVPPGTRMHLAFELKAPRRSGQYPLRLQLGEPGLWPALRKPRQNLHESVVEVAG